MNRLLSGIIEKSTGSWYKIRDSETGRTVMSKITGKIRLQGSRATNPVVVGDIVDYQTDDTGTGVITAIHPRRNYIIRRSSNLSKESHIIAANIDQAFLVATLDFPVTSYEFIDRFLVTAEAYKIPAVIILNKTDLYNTPELAALKEEFLRVYSLAGYEVIEASATGGEGIEELRSRLKNKVSLFSGNSGVGKSTIIKAIDPTLDIRIGEISDYHKKGRHTTTFSEMFPLAEGGYIIDTPGIKGFGLIDIAEGELGHYFPDLFRISKNCSYYNCTHTHEPSCAVKDAVEEGRISMSRYISYLKLLENDDKHRK